MTENRVGFTALLRVRDELSPRNFRKRYLIAFLIFPASVIIGDLRYLDQDMALFGMDSTTLILTAHGIGWLVTAFLPRRHLLTAFRCAAALSAAALPFQIFMDAGLTRLWIYLFFHFVNGVCVAYGVYLFCFFFNNVERFFAMVILQLYYAAIYLFWDITAVADFLKTYGSAAAMLLVLIIAILFRDRDVQTPISSEPLKGSAVPLVLSIDVIYFVLMLMTLYIEYAETRVSSALFGVGAFVSVAVVFIIQLLVNKSALYIWSLCLILVVLGVAALLFDDAAAIAAGSFVYGLGDGLGYVIIFYMLGYAIKRSNSYKMFRLCCLVTAFEYVFVNGVFDYAYAHMDLPNHNIAFVIVIVLVCACFFLAPALQKRLFDADWTDGFHMIDVMAYAHEATAVEETIAADGLGLTPREKEVFVLLLTDMSQKEIYAKLKISNGTFNFHAANLYRKLGVQSRVELFTKHKT
ncbi:MAG: helix-turn-helix transcriptional regulator [Clostridiales Family XIII bacterium]|nr:helix-turn-helix transcriptional regulator [Clostridiales Family XIII bacterium]